MGIRLLLPSAMRSVLLVVLVSAVAARVDSVKDLITVIMPKALAQDVGDRGAIPAKSALFGKFYYGRTLDAPFRLLKRNATDADLFACGRIQVDVDKLDRPFIGLVRRGGGCTFVTKARNVQDAGAAAMVVVNNDSEEPDYMGIPPNQYARSNSIDIPVMMIRKIPGEKIIDFITDPKSFAVRGQVQVLKPNPANKEKLNVDLYLRLDDNAAKFMKTFALALSSLKDTVNFSVHFVLDKDLSKASCTNHQRYCAQNRDVVFETLRQLCISKNHGWMEWASYYNTWTSKCGSNNDFSEACFRQIFRDPDSIQTCITESGGLEDDAINSMLEAQIRDPRRIRYSPLLIINDSVFESQLTCNSVHDCAPLSFLCMMFADGDQPATCFTSSACESFGEIPDVCGTCRPFGDKAAVTEPSVCPPIASRYHHHIPFATILFIFIALSLIMFLVIVLINRHMQKLMRIEVDAIMNEYTPLHDAYPDSPSSTSKHSYRIPAA